jgi:tRNA(fMet)-specific endonuclease VapC
LPTLIDTDVAIHLRDGDPWTEQQAAALSPPLQISAISRVELENGVYRDPQWSAIRSGALDQLLTFVETLAFGSAEIAEYQAVVAAVGFSKRKTSDRMTAATAIAQGIPLVTLNGRDFRDIPGLALIAWERPSDPTS